MKFEMLGVSTSLLAANSLDLYHTTLERRTTKRGGGMAQSNPFGRPWYIQRLRVGFTMVLYKTKQYYEEP